jgi:polyisoprenoid-binding protein YceI
MTSWSNYRRAAAAGSALAVLIVAAPTAGQPSVQPSAVRAGQFALDKSHAKLNWAVSHFGFSTYSGEFTDFDARLTLSPKRPADSSLLVTIKTASVETNDDALDKHLRSPDFLNSDRHPTATFRSAKVQMAGERTARVTGNLTLNGVTKPLTLDVRFEGAGVSPVTKKYVAGFAAKGQFNRSDFGIKTYSPGIGEAVTLTISGEFNPVSASATR